jgi:hypothetical protein
MSDTVLYLGDTALQGAAAYLAGMIHRWGWSFDYVPSDRAAAGELFDTVRPLFILSDYPASQLEPSLQARLVRGVADGAGLLMIGGWESYHGCGGGWQGTPVAAALPVDISRDDDRVNCDQPALVRSVCDHPITQDLPWASRPPCIGGFNRITAKTDSLTVLETQRFTASQTQGRFAFEPADCDPLLVVGRYGKGRVAALATDVAPHWVGGLVDWGPSRVVAQAPGAETIEVGDLYDRFFHQLLGWTGRLTAS